MSVKVGEIWDTVPGSGLCVSPRRSGDPRRYGPQAGVNLDLVNRDILFHNLVKMGWTDRVIKTLRNLFGEKNIHVKHKGKISSSFNNGMGVNQGGVLSGLLYRKYMCNLGNHLKSEVVVCIETFWFISSGWVDDLFVISNTVAGLLKTNRWNIWIC